MAVFKNQGYTLITAETSIDLTSADNKRILYKKPSGTSGYFSANASGTSLTYQCDNADLDENGIWEFQAYAEIGGLKAYGAIFKEEIKKPIA